MYEKKLPFIPLKEQLLVELRKWSEVVESWRAETLGFPLAERSSILSLW